MPDRAGGLLTEKFLCDFFDLSSCISFSRPSETEVRSNDF